MKMSRGWLYGNTPGSAAEEVAVESVTCIKLIGKSKIRYFLQKQNSTAVTALSLYDLIGMWHNFSALNVTIIMH